MKTIRIETAGKFQILRLDRGKANAINHSMVTELQEAFWQLQHDSTCYGVLLTGKENFFSAGLDVIELYDYSEAELVAFWRSLSALIKQMVSFPKPLVCAVNGHSPAGGCLLAICCDERIMAEGTFRIGLNEVQVGIAVPSSIFDLYGFWLGMGKAFQLILEGKLLEHHEALQLGLINAVVPQCDIEEIALNRLELMAGFQTEVWSISKAAGRKELIEKLSKDFDADFGPTLEQWWKPESRAIMQGLITKLKK